MFLSDILLGAFTRGLILALVTYSVMLPFRLLMTTDLTAEGSYPTGGAVCAVLLLAGVNPSIAVVIAALSAGLLGVGTGLLHLRLRIDSLLSGIIITTMAYSVNLRIMGMPNISLFKSANLFSLSDGAQWVNNALLIIVHVLLLVALFVFLRTEVGLRMRLVGLNPVLARSNSVSRTFYILLALFWSSALAGLAGALMVNWQKYMDISMGVGILISALAALILGEMIIGNNTLPKQLLAPLFGALVYQSVQALALTSGLPSSDLRLFTGAVLIGVIALRRGKL